MSMPNESERPQPNRRDFLRTSGIAATGALFLPPLEVFASTPGFSTARQMETARAGRVVQPFALSDVKLTESIFTQKRDRMLAYARGYGGEENIYAGPDRVLSIFRANAGLDTKGAQPVGSWGERHRISARTLRRPLHDDARAGVRGHR
jgi:hypothetical protein